MCYNEIREDNIIPILHRLDNEVNIFLRQSEITTTITNLLLHMITATTWPNKQFKPIKIILFLFYLELMLHFLQTYGVDYCGKLISR